MEIEYTDVKNLRWGTADRTVISCEVNFSHIPDEYVPFAAVASGDLPHTHKIFAECVDGRWGVIQDFVPPVDSEPNVSTALG